MSDKMIRIHARTIQTPITPIVHPKLDLEKESVANLDRMNRIYRIQAGGIILTILQSCLKSRFP
jgi:hypothetical protein